MHDLPDLSVSDFESHRMTADQSKRCGQPGRRISESPIHPTTSNAAVRDDPLAFDHEAMVAVDLQVKKDGRNSLEIPQMGGEGWRRA
ncbi:MAG: hypothetical protein ACREI8_13855 [Myxococcota bacterium]